MGFVSDAVNGLGNLFNKGVDTFTGGQGSTDAERKQDQLVQQKLNDANANLQAQNEGQSRLVGSAQDYRNKMPGMADSAGGAGEDQARLSFDQQMRSNASGAQSRGLLYSGLKQQQDQNAAVQMGSGMDQNRMQVNNELNNQANQMDQSAVGSGQNLYAQRQALNDIQYQNTMKQREIQGQQAQGIGSGIGGLLGTVFGGQAGGQAGSKALGGISKSAGGM